MPYSRRTEQEAATMAAAGELMQGLRAVVIGGGGGGIGAAITVAIAAAGADVAIVDVDDARAKAATDSAVKYGHKAIPVVADIRDPDDIERMVAEARDALGGIDVLVTVVGGLMAWRAPFHRMHEVADDEWDFVFDVNLKYVYRVLKATLRVMIEQGTGGSVVSIGSDAGTAGHDSPNMAAYGAAKSGLAHLVTTIAAEYGPDGIRMNMVSPGPTETGATSALSAEHIAGMNAAIPLRCRGKPEDIANAVVFFASPMSKQVTGQVLGVDGGVSMADQRPPDLDPVALGRRDALRRRQAAAAAGR
jgi:3-oxoacyl-[acyl-carrier protein] reductase